MVPSQGKYELIKPNNLIILLERHISKNVKNTYKKCNNIPRLWRIFFLKIANNRDYVYNFCDTPFNDFHRHCREWHLYNYSDGDDIRMLDDEMNNYGAYW